MHPRIAELIAYLDTHFESVREAYHSVPADRRDARPAGDAWSPAEIITHLAVVERRVSGLISKLIADARASGVGQEHDVSPVLPSIDVASVMDRSQKIKAPLPTDPRTTGETLGWNDYEQSRAALKSAVLGGDGLAMGEVMHPHPAFGPISLYSWIAFSGAHAARHAAQMREAASAKPA